MGKNPALQPRGFVTLGCLLQEDEIYDHILVFQILLSLLNSLRLLESQSHFDLVISILMCITKIVPTMPK